MWFYLHDALRVVRFIETESRMLVARGGGEESGKLMLRGYRVSVLQDKNHSRD